MYVSLVIAGNDGVKYMMMMMIGIKHDIVIPVLYLRQWQAMGYSFWL